MLRRLPVSNSADFEVSAGRLWEAISMPGNLNDSHPCLLYTSDAADES